MQICMQFLGQTDSLQFFWFQHGYPTRLPLILGEINNIHSAGDPRRRHDQPLSAIGENCPSDRLGKAFRAPFLRLSPILFFQPVDRQAQFI